MNQEPDKPQVDPITKAAPGVTPTADGRKCVLVGAGPPAADQIAWSFEAEHILRDVPAKPGGIWKEHEATGYAVYKIRLLNRQPGGETLDVLVLTLAGDKLREALLSLAEIASGGELFDELYRRQKDSGNLSNSPPDQPDQVPEEQR